MSVVESKRAHDRLSQLSRRSSREGIGMSPMSLRSSRGLGMRHNTHFLYTYLFLFNNTKQERSQFWGLLHFLFL
jgi:hypothetical protein